MVHSFWTHRIMLECSTIIPEVTVTVISSEDDHYDVALVKCVSSDINVPLTLTLELPLSLTLTL